MQVAGPHSQSGCVGRFWVGPENWHFFIFERETESKQGKGRQRGRYEIQSRLQALNCQHRARPGTQTHNYEIMT